jgi:diguanylate cyclase (GGDEF)-like protein
MRSVQLEESNAELVEANGKLEEMNSRLEIAANTDQMTGVLNRRAFSRDYEEIWNASLLKKTRIATAIFDIDFFKAYNDKFGHLEGDKCLQMIAGSLRESFKRQNDIVSRYGGEEFLVVFDASEDDAYSLVERARQAVEDLGIPHAKTTVSPYVTISAGVSVMIPSKAVSNDTALRIADDALYESKHNGRNRITMKKYGES